MTARYTIDGGYAGKQRLDLLARVCAPGTTAVLDRVGVRRGARCLDAGCGGGHVSQELARRAGGGHVVAVDLDDAVLDLAAADAAAAGIATIEFRRGDATALSEPGFDVAYARFLLSHLREPAQMVATLAAALAPAGAAVLEDVSFGGYICHPPCVAHDDWLAMYRETVRRRGGNADLGPALPSLLRDAGFENVVVAVSRHAVSQATSSSSPR